MFIRPGDVANDLRKLVRMVIDSEDIRETTFPALEAPLWAAPHWFDDARGAGFELRNVENGQRFEVTVREVA